MLIFAFHEFMVIETTAQPIKICTYRLHWTTCYIPFTNMAINFDRAS